MVTINDGIGSIEGDVAALKAKGCTAVLTWLGVARRTIANDPTCEVYLGLEGPAASAYPTAFYFSEQTSQGVIQSIDTAITNWKLNGVIDDLHDWHYSRRHVCPDSSFKRLDALDLIGLVLLVVPCYLVAMLLKLKKDGLACKRPEAPATKVTEVSASAVRVMEGKV